MGNRVQIWITYTLPLILWWIAMFVATTIPGKALPKSPIFTADKLIHALMYLGLTLFFYRFLRGVKKLYIIQSIIITIVVVALYGIFDEWHQGFVGRTPSHLDYYADLLGVAIAGIIIVIRKLIVKLFFND